MKTDGSEDKNKTDREKNIEKMKRAENKNFHHYDRKKEKKQADPNGIRNQPALKILIGSDGESENEKEIFEKKKI